MMKAKTKVLAAAFLGLLFSLPAGEPAAAEIAGVSLPEQVTLESSGDRLVLNGAGVRKKFVIKVYVGALYLPAKSADVGQILAAPGAKRVTMHFLYKEVEAEKLVEGWDKGFAANLGAGELEAVRERLALFNALFRTVRSGDVYQLDLVPGTGTEVRLNGEVLGAVPGEDFYRALLKVWLGGKPADKGLKKAWLGR